MRSTALMPQSSPRWLDVLRACGEEVDVLSIDGGMLAYAIRRTDIGTVLSSLPYIAYGGPIAHDDDPSVIRALLDEYVARAQQLGAAALTIGTPPFLSRDVERVWRESFAPAFVHDNFAQVSDLGGYPHAMLTKPRQGAVRRQVRTAVTHGLRAERASTHEQLAAWRAIYELRYAEIGAFPYPESMHRAMFELLIANGEAELWLALRDDAILGGTLFLIDAHTADYFAASYASEHFTLFPQDLVLDTAFRSFVERGITRLNWESSPSRSGGVYTFKSRWGGVEVPVYYYSRVLDESLLDHTPQEIREAFPLRFVVPFSALRAPS